MLQTNKCILMLGCFDTKAEDFTFLYNCLKAQGECVVTVNTGVMGTTENFPVDIEADVVALEAGHSIIDLRNKGDRGEAVKIMGAGAAKIVAKLVIEKKIKGAIGMGGGAGTFITLLAMQEIPFGVAKLCLSTWAGKDLSRQTGSKDITLMPSIVDMAGLNSISKVLIKQAGAAVCAMANVNTSADNTSAGSIAISMFGNTSACVDKCSELLRAKGYEIFPFHANGVGGSTMESLIREGCFNAVLDITTTELADELCGGICSAGSERLNAAAEMNIPQVVVPGCLDMVNFAQFDTVPDRYKDREFYQWSPNVTLMRTNMEENKILGERLAKKINRSMAAVAVVLPLKGISQIDAEGEIFYRPEINQVLFKTIKEYTSPTLNVIEADAHINDEKFSRMLVELLLGMMEKKSVPERVQ